MASRMRAGTLRAGDWRELARTTDTAPGRARRTAGQEVTSGSKPVFCFARLIVVRSVAWPFVVAQNRLGLPGRWDANPRSISSSFSRTFGLSRPRSPRRLGQATPSPIAPAYRMAASRAMPPSSQYAWPGTQASDPRVTVDPMARGTSAVEPGANSNTFQLPGSPAVGATIHTTEPAGVAQMSVTPGEWSSNWFSDGGTADTTSRLPDLASRRETRQADGGSFEKPSIATATKRPDSARRRRARPWKKLSPIAVIRPVGCQSAKLAS